MQIHGPSKPSQSVGFTLGQVSGLSGSFLPLTGGSLGGPGNLAVGGTLGVAGATTLNGGITAPDIGFSVLATGAKCDGTTDDTTAIATALASGHKLITIPAGKTCYSATGVVVPANVVLTGMSFAFGYPANAAQSSMIQCARNTTACVTINTVASNSDAAGIRDIVVSTQATSGSPPTSGTCIHIVGGYNIVLEHVAVSQCYDGYWWDGSGTANGTGISGRMIDTYGGAIADAYIIQDSWPELRISQSRFGSNGSGDYAANAFIREQGGVSGQPGVLPNGVFVTNTQFNQGSSSVKHWLEFVNCTFCGPNYYNNGWEWIFSATHVENIQNALYSDSSWGSIQGLHIVGAVVSGDTFFALDPATVLFESVISGSTISLNQSGAGFVLNSPVGSPLYDTITGNDFVSNVTLNSQNAGSVVDFSNNIINENLTLSGPWTTLNAIGNTWGSSGTFTNTATGNVSVIAGPQRGAYSATYSPTTDHGSFAIGFNPGNTLINVTTGTNLHLLAFGPGALAVAGNLATEDIGIGYDALNSDSSGSSNVAIGSNAGLNLTTANSDTLVGFASGQSLTTGGSNTFIGYGVGSMNPTTGSGNILIGTSNGVNTDAAGTNNEINIGNSIKAVNGGLVASNIQPTVSAACSSPTVSPNGGGTWGFVFQVGTGCGSTSTGTLGMPAAPDAWVCTLIATTAPDTRYVAQTGGNTTAVTFTSYSRTTGVATPLIDGDTIRGSCFAY